MTECYIMDTILSMVLYTCHTRAEPSMYYVCVHAQTRMQAFLIELARALAKRAHARIINNYTQCHVYYFCKVKVES